MGQVRPSRYVAGGRSVVGIPGVRMCDLRLAHGNLPPRFKTGLLQAGISRCVEGVVTGSMGWDRVARMLDGVVSQRQ